MKLSNEQIASILIKDISCKTLLLDADKLESTIAQYIKDGWELVNKVELNSRYKVTFRKVK